MVQRFERIGAWLPSQAVGGGAFKSHDETRRTLRRLIASCLRGVFRTETAIATGRRRDMRAAQRRGMGAERNLDRNSAMESDRHVGTAQWYGYPQSFYSC